MVRQMLLVLLLGYASLPDCSAVEPGALSFVFKDGRLQINGKAVGNNLPLNDLRGEILKLGEVGETYNDFGFHSTIDSRLVFCASGEKRQVFMVGARMSDLVDGKVTVSINGKNVEGNGSIEALAKDFSAELLDLGARRKEILSDTYAFTFILNEDGKTIDYVMFQVDEPKKKVIP